MRFALLLGLISCLILLETTFSSGASKPESALKSLIDLNLQTSPRSAVPRWGRDPFILNKIGAKKEQGEDKISLSAIIFREGKGVAIINDQIVRQGDQIGGEVVSDILADRVILRGGGRVIELRVDPFMIK
jgi:hypothetical protein